MPVLFNFLSVNPSIWLIFHLGLLIPFFTRLWPKVVLSSDQLKRPFFDILHIFFFHFSHFLILLSTSLFIILSLLFVSSFYKLLSLMHFSISWILIDPCLNSYQYYVHLTSLPFFLKPAPTDTIFFLSDANLFSFDSLILFIGFSWKFDWYQKEYSL